MQTIYHLVLKADWEVAQGPFAPKSLDAEGFVHCSHAHQVERSANRFFAGAGELFLLHLDAGKVGDLREEPADSGETFPHIYGPIPRQAVLAVEELKRDGAGRWTFTASLSPAPPAPPSTGSDSR